MKNQTEKFTKEIADLESALERIRGGRAIIVADRDKLQAQVVAHSANRNQSHVAMAYGQAMELSAKIHEYDLEERSTLRKIALRREKVDDAAKKRARETHPR